MSLSSARARRGAVVVESDERVVEHQRRVGRLRHLANDTQSGAQVELVERALGQPPDVDPVVDLGREDA